MSNENGEQPQTMVQFEQSISGVQKKAFTINKIRLSSILGTCILFIKFHRYFLTLYSILRKLF